MEQIHSINVKVRRVVETMARSHYPQTMNGRSRVLSLINARSGCDLKRYLLKVIVDFRQDVYRRRIV